MIGILSDTDPVSPSGVDLDDLVRRLASRSQPRTEADIQADVRDLLLRGDFNLGPDDLAVRLEVQVGDRNRIDVEAGFTVIEVKKDLRPKKVLSDAVEQLAGYIAQRTLQLGQRYVGVLTDGSDWRCYHLDVGGELEDVSRHQVDADDPQSERLCVWLEAILATEVAIRPTPQEIDRRIGAESPGHALERAALLDLWSVASKAPEAQLKRRLWARLLTTAFGSQFSDDDRLFVEHTYLVLTAEMIAHAVLGLDPTTTPPAALVTGRQFADVGIHGLAEADFFDWVLATPGGEGFIRTLARRVARFSWGSVEHDVLKHLYQSVIDERQRHQLGEYYTPDWLAEKLVQEAVSQPLSQRVLDPACGSGTFLFHAVRRRLAAADEAGVDNAEALEAVTRCVLGIDIHPVAVILARVTYLLAMGSERLQGDRGELSIPVYLGDSMQWHTDGTALVNGQLVVYVDDERGLFSEELAFPADLLARPDHFDRLVEQLTMLAANREPGAALPSITAILSRYQIADADRPVLEATFSILCSLHDQGRDHIWGYYARNLARPIWMNLERASIDVLVGNPPWLSFRYMPGEMQKTFRRESQARKLWAGAKVATHQDLSAYFVVKSVEAYLRDHGRFAFVMPLAVLSRLGYQGFRDANFGPGLAVRFEQPWDCEDISPPLFPVPSSVVFGTRSDGQPSAMPSTAIKWSGRLPSSAAHSWSTARDHLHKARSRLPESVSPEDFSPYRVRFSQGATVVPRVLHLVEEAPDATLLGLPRGVRMVRSRRSPLEKDPWRGLPDRGPATIESQFVFDLHLGSTVVPYRLLAPELVVLPMLDGALLSGADQRIEASPKLATWWREAEALWRRHRSDTTTMELADWVNYQNKLVAQFPVAENRVVYSASGNSLAAAVVNNYRAVVEHKLYWAACESAAEARYLEAIFNSATLTARVQPLQSRGLFGPRDFDKYVFQLPIPLFDPSQESHRLLADAAGAAERVAAQVSLPPGLDFKTARARVREALRADGVAGVVDALASKVLGSGEP